MTARRHFLAMAAALAISAAPAFAQSTQPNPAAATDSAQLTVYAAASMKNALDDVNTAYTAATEHKVVVSYAASSALMKQIEQGAPADVFVSADTEWMDYGAERWLIKNDSRINLLGNRLVLIAPANSKISSVVIGADTKLAELLGGGRLVTGDVRAVPAGKYAKAALEKLGLWTSVESKMAMAENVRAALALVAREEAPLGIVYETDAKVEPKVKIVGVFPADSHTPITYPVAVTAQGNTEAQRYVDFLRTNTAKAIFEKYGFTYLIKPVS